MLRIFRKMRNAALSENKLVRYLFYALGEIILVVIGILIALQVNNRNEQRKNHLLELKFLKNLNQDLVHDEKQLGQLTDLRQTKSEKCIKLLYLTKNKSDIDLYEFSSDILYLLFGADFVPNNNTYTKLSIPGV